MTLAKAISHGRSSGLILVSDIWRTISQRDGPATKNVRAPQTPRRLVVQRSRSFTFRRPFPPSPVTPQCSLWLFSAYSVLNSEKPNTEAAKNHREPQRDGAARS